MGIGYWVYPPNILVLGVPPQYIGWLPKTQYPTPTRGLARNKSRTLAAVVFWRCLTARSPDCCVLSFGRSLALATGEGLMGLMGPYGPNELWKAGSPPCSCVRWLKRSSGEHSRLKGPSMGVGYAATNQAPRRPPHLKPHPPRFFIFFIFLFLYFILFCFFFIFYFFIFLFYFTIYIFFCGGSN